MRKSGPDIKQEGGTSKRDKSQLEGILSHPQRKVQITPKDARFRGTSQNNHRGETMTNSKGHDPLGIKRSRCL
ncbi:hypothetical protein C922_05834 [Plasmodium inui San Antonio 1]|uniref:Uncharacterized protein n=1 Tax=Plasmodium inui San Antonio 1 TaxID=1237626 RepID=W7AEU2_9APIC|nr:hypothetical protein C922_05834 [Plasmodium inui San Antonio 1]EUD63781.1 hypothetical protein C922_05834 [Plasmodium inui San Antonio 1]